MKDSGLVWIGEIPNNWVACKLKYSLSHNDGGVWGDEPENDEDAVPVIRSTEQTIDGEWNIESPAYRDISKIKNYQYYQIKSGDLLITKSSGSQSHIGKTTLASKDEESAGYYYSNFLQRISCNFRIDPKYLWYIMNNQCSREQFVFMQNSTSGLGNINGSDISNLYTPLPSISIQQRIVHYLNIKCKALDNLILRQRYVIEKLKEYKQAFITEVVTKGLNPHIRFKDSGVEWLGLVPEHWSINRIGNVYTDTSEPGNESLPILSVSINSGVSDKELSDEESDRVFVRSEDRSKYKRVRPGDLTYNMMRAWQGAFGAVRVDGMVSPAYIVARPKAKGIDTRYIEALMRTPLATEEMHRYSHGIADFRLRLYWPEFKNIKICLPDLSEQQQIADYIDMKSAEIESSIAKRESLIAKLTEYKKSLIYEVVTGKKEV